MERIGDEVSRALSRSGDGAALALAEITAVWSSSVGEAVARQAWPLRIGRDGTLHIATSSSTWAFELDRMAADVLARLQSALGPKSPTSIRFRPGPIPEPGASDAAAACAPRVIEATPEDAATADLATAPIEDPELRALVARAVRASLARARSDQRI
jgi:hypothetical protein